VYRLALEAKCLFLENVIAVLLRLKSVRLPRTNSIVIAKAAGLGQDSKS